MTVTGFLMWAIFCTVIGLLAGAAASTVFNVRRDEASREDGGFWFRRYALCVGGGLFLLNPTVRYLFWFGRSWDSGNTSLRLHAAVSAFLIVGMIVAAVIGWRVLRKAQQAERTAPYQPGGVILPTVNGEIGWWVVSCRHGHEVYVRGGAPGAYCQVDGDWVQLGQQVQQ